MRRKFVAALVIAVLAGCTGPQNPGGASSSSLNVYLYQEPAGLFGPLAPSSGPDNQVMSFLHEGLLGVDPNYELQPRLAESYEVSDDAMTFTFTLRKGLLWSDGTPFTAKDVLFTYELLADPRTTSATAGNYKAVADFSAPDDNTFVIKATAPNYGLVSLVGTAAILPEHVLSGIAPEAVAKDEYFRAPKVTIGPYTFVEYRTNQYVHVTANPRYRTPAKIKDVYLKPMTSDSATAQLGNGGIDIASYSPTDLGTVTGFTGVSTQEKPGAGFVRIGLNQSKDFFTDVRIRQAFLYAVDREQIVETVLAGKGEVRLSDFAPDDAPDDLNTYAYDPEKARRLLTEAGWDVNRTVNLQWVAGQRDRDATATIVQNQLSEVGVKVNLVNVQAAQIVRTFQDKSYDMLLYGGGNYAVDASSVNNITACSLHYPAGGNINFFCDPTLDDLMTRANATTDEAQRRSLYEDAARRENEQADLMWLYSPDGLWGVNDRVQGFEAPGSQDSAFWDPASWSVV